MPERRKIEIDSSKLTLDDWSIIEDIQEGRMAVRAARAMVVRCSDWTDEELGKLGADALRDILKALNDALVTVINQKN